MSTKLSAGRTLTIGAAVLLVVAGVALPASPAAALSSGDITVGADVARAGALIPVKVTGLYSTPTCRLSVVGPAQGKAVVIKVRNSEAKARIRLPGAAGVYRVRAACGKDGTATSAPFVVVGRTSPLAATCEVLESGFSVDSKHWYVSFGAVVRNTSPELSATDVEVAFTFKDAAGNVILNYGLRPGDVPPGSTIVAGRTSIVANGATSLTVIPRCTTAIEKVTPVVPGGGSVYVYPNISIEIGIRGQFANPASFPVSGQAPIGFILRDPADHIIAGGNGYLDGFIPAGGTGTWHWEEFSWDRAYGTPDSVQSTLWLEPA